MKGLLSQSFLQKFKPSKVLFLERKGVHTLPCFSLKCDHNHRICYNICFPFCMGLKFSYEQFQHIFVFNWVFAGFRSFHITSDYLIPCFSRFSSGKLTIILKVLHLLSNKSFSSIKVFFTLNLHPCYLILI